MQEDSGSRIKRSWPPSLHERGEAGSGTWDGTVKMGNMEREVCLRGNRLSSVLEMADLKGLDGICH